MDNNGINIPIRLTFLEPYRLVERLDEEERKKSRGWLRGQSFARWRKNESGSGGKAYITGTLLRSAVIKAAEELISLNGGKWDGEDCCNGKFETDQSNENQKTTFLRKRHTLTWKSERDACQTEEDVCPYCTLLGRFDVAGKDHRKNKIKDYDIHFDNLEFVKKRDTKCLLNDIATERIVNRVDFKTSKAHDYFRIWEVDHDDCPEYTGTITLNNSKAENLLRDALRFVDKLCGALCRIEVANASINLHSSKEEQIGVKSEGGITNSGSKDDPEKQLINKLNKDVNDKLINCAKDVIDAFERAEKLEKARALADAVRAMRLKGAVILESDKLPHNRKDEGSEKKENMEHHLWDKVRIGNEPLWKTLKSLWIQNRNNITWRHFCDYLGNELYLQYKEKRGGLPDKYRILGETEFYSKQEIGAHGQKAGHFVTVSSIGAVKEWIIVGKLKSETPFFFGFDNSGNEKKEDFSGEQTSFRILLDKKGRYRVPRSLIRGVLRRDLRIAFGDSGCNVELGGATPCACQVCTVMRKITVKDTRSDDYYEPPEIRHRIRLNPYTSIVDEGALLILR